MKRFFSIALTICIAATAALTGTISAAAEAYTATLAAIEAYNKTHGDTYESYSEFLAANPQ
jgi:hypothetical protein